ncbi:MAG TPA: glycosyltransferase family 87 protein [Terriglobia bacterium]|nr:glycosyltransferase family 87 protein [Terriglobia bacterium]
MFKSRGWIPATVVLVLLVLQWINASPLGDVEGKYTDHLRHEVEALAFVSRGFVVYREPYRQFADGLWPCADHRALFDERTAPYPPLGILLHWPVARLESGGMITAYNAHRLLGALWMGAGLLSFLVVRRLVDEWKAADWITYGALLAPLLVGAGANGFYDTTYFLMGVSALLCLKKDRTLPAGLLLGLSVAMSFRAIVFAPLGLWAIARSLEAGYGRAFRILLVSVPWVAFSAASAWALGGSLEVIPAESPVHFSRVVQGEPAAVTFVALGVGLIAWLLVRGYRWTGLSVLSMTLVVLLDRSLGFWHALPYFVPGLVFAVEAPRASARARWLALLFLLCGLTLGFRGPTRPSWGWLRTRITQLAHP